MHYPKCPLYKCLIDKCPLEKCIIPNVRCINVWFPNVRCINVGPHAEGLFDQDDQLRHEPRGDRPDNHRQKNQLKT